MNKEFEFLNIISNTLSNSKYLGDDCAYLKEYDLCVSSDSLIEGVHFLFKYMSPYEVAKKALLVNISDILASGANPKFATISLSGDLNNSFIEEFYKGINEIALKYNFAIIGGDLTKSDKISISITIFGDCKNRNISKRSNAQNGYIIAAMGEFGSSAQGLEDFKKNIKDNYFTNYHKNPKLYPEISNLIATKTQKPYAMMDSSDGLVDCLMQISAKSKVGMDIDYSKIPHKTQNKDYILYGGEDYSLVVCLFEEDFKKIPNLIKIGKCTNTNKVFINNKEIKYKGYKHFE